MIRRALLPATVALLVGVPVAADQAEHAAHKHPSGRDKHMQNDVSIDWSLALAKDGRSLDLSYTVANDTKERIFILDQLPTSKEGTLALAKNAVVVVNADDVADAVRFVKGRVPSDKPTQLSFYPGATAIEPGKKLTGSAHVPLPLVAWNNLGWAVPIKGNPKQAVLAIDYVQGDASWGALALGDGTKLTIPQPGTDVKHLVGATKPIPVK
jgi:hypothetical protein